MKSDTSLSSNTVSPINRKRFPLGGWEVSLCALLVSSVIGFSIAAPGFYNDAPGFLQLSENFLPFGIVALGLSLVILTGGIDLSVGATAGLSAVIAAQLWSAYGLNIWLASGIGLVLGAALGFINAAVIIRLRVEPLIATLATSFIYTSAAVAVAGDNPPSGFPDSFNALGTQGLTLFGIDSLLPFQLLLFVGLAFIFWLLVAKSAFGRRLVMVGYSADAARYSGIRVGRVVTAAYVISGIMAALSGIVLASYYSAVRPDMGDVLLLTTITMVVLGGVSIFGGDGTIFGVVIAVLLLGFIRQGMLIAGFSDMVTSMFTGAILLTSIAIKNLINPRGFSLRHLLGAQLSRFKNYRAASE